MPYFNAYFLGKSHCFSRKKSCKKYIYIVKLAHGEFQNMYIIWFLGPRHNPYQFIDWSLYSGAGKRTTEKVGRPCDNRFAWGPPIGKLYLNQPICQISIQVKKTKNVCYKRICHYITCAQCKISHFFLLCT